jgi:thiol:disulfide interchange protein
MGHLRVILGFTIYCLVVWVAPKLVMVVSGLFAGALLLFVVFGALSDSGSAKPGSWKSSDVDARD